TRYRNIQADNPVYLSDYRQKNSSLGLKSATEYKLEPISINLGLELSRQSYERQDNLIVLQSIGLRKRYQKAASLNLLTESELNYFANKLQAGIRVDDVTEYEPFVSWRLEDVFTFESSFIWQAGAYIGSSFSLPSFYDLYWKGDAQSLGNPDLQPETSLGGSIWTGISYLDNSLKIAYYRSEVKKLIQWHQTYLYGPQWKPLNIGKARLQNWEITASLQPVKWLKLSASTVFTKAVDIDMNANLTYTPDAKGNAGIMLSYLNTVLDLNLDYTGRQWKTRDNVIDPIPAYTLYNAALSRSFSYRKCSSSVFVRLNNLFDKQYEIYDYVPQPGFNWLCGLNLQYRM
ncbi:MAG: TonB-dependent receptor, partial [Candidatus Cloacimonetes bacterium]|nr:TonB-dependent receptor [Candidatus Cloacimonadota bacterium]